MLHEENVIRKEYKKNISSYYTELPTTSLGVHLMVFLLNFKGPFIILYAY